MDALRDYFANIIFAAFFCGLLVSIIKRSKTERLVRFLSGLVLLLVAIQDLTDIRSFELQPVMETISHSAETLTAEGEAMANEAMKQIIIADTEAYILTKADTLQAELSVSVEVDSEGIPTMVQLSGDISSGKKAELQRIIETDLGIAKENQLWTG